MPAGIASLDMSVLRAYEVHELGANGYPHAWHRLPDDVLLDWAPGQRLGIKDLVRHDAGHRCARCKHPYRTGESPPEWSPCDARCTHAGPYRLRRDGPTWTEYPHAGRGAAVAAYMVAQGFTVEAAWRVLTVHHLDGRKPNCRWWNLVPLCQRCHLQIQGKVVMERIWPWPHTDWFRPYVAGYYAHVYLREDLTRDEVTSRLDELLALERLA
jgi:hypothetical protein